MRREEQAHPLASTQEKERWEGRSTRKMEKERRKREKNLEKNEKIVKVLFSPPNKSSPLSCFSPGEEEKKKQTKRKQKDDYSLMVRR